MDSSGVLLALDEQRKWRERRKRIEDRLAQIDRRRGYLVRELEHARRKLGEYTRILGQPTPVPRGIETTLPSPGILR